MDGGERRLTTKGIVFFGALTVILLLTSAADDVVRGDPAGSVAGAVLSVILLSTLYVFGIGWAWKERKLGYGIVFVLSAATFVAFIIVDFGLLGQASLEAIAAAYTSEAVRFSVVFTFVVAGLTSLMALLLSLYALAVPMRG